MFKYYTPIVGAIYYFHIKDRDRAFKCLDINGKEITMMDIYAKNTFKWNLYHFSTQMHNCAIGKPELPQEKTKQTKTNKSSKSDMAHVLTKTELELVTNFRKLNDHQQNKVLGFIHALYH
ncbi:MAG: hypothetical protein IJY84_01375 [Clostridia bacterium]|nr:hypothetical protein [Clostridia bacterium]